MCGKMSAMNAPRRKSSGSIVIAQLTGEQLENISLATRNSKAALKKFNPDIIHEIIVGVFRQFSCSSVDLDALIYMVLREFAVEPNKYVGMHSTVKSHILSNFVIKQGEPLAHTEVNMRRINVLNIIHKQEE